MAEEYEFWRRWLDDHISDACPLEPFHLQGREDTVKQIDDELRTSGKPSEVFVLVIRINVQNGVFEVVSLVKDKGWRLTRWEELGRHGWKKAVSEKAAVEEEVVRRLSGKAVYVDASDIWVFHADSVYTFVRYHGKCSRFAVYNPQYEAASAYDPDDDTGKKAERDPVAAALRSLFGLMEMAP